MSTIHMEPMYGARILGRESFEDRFVLQGSDVEAEIFGHLLSNTPRHYDSSILDKRLDRGDERVEELGGGTWIGSVRYTPPDKSDDGGGSDGGGGPGSTFSFDTTGATQHITQSLKTVTEKGLHSLPPAMHGAILVGPNGEVAGTDILIPQFKFGEQHTLRAAAIDFQYVDRLARLTGRTNSGPFRGFAEGEVLFAGATGSRDNAKEWTIQFQFLVSPHKQGLKIGDIPAVDKRGWDFLWVLYQQREDQTAKRLIPEPVGVYIERVYEAGDFIDLGILT